MLPHKSGFSGISIAACELLAGGPAGGPEGGPVGGPDGGPVGGPAGGPAGGPSGGLGGPGGGVGGPAGGVGGPAGGVGGPAGGLGGPGGGAGGPAGGVGGPAGGVGGVSGDSGASLTEAELGACASNGSSVLEGCESGASRTGLALRIGASLASLLEVNPVDRVSNFDVIIVSPPSEFSAE